jgi:hypothetical protein
MARIELFRMVHKGLRAELYSAVTLAGRTDFRNSAEAARVAAAALRLLELLEEHAAHEDEVVLPQLSALVPEFHAALQTDHARLKALQDDVRQFAARLQAAAGDAEREALGGRLHNRLGRLTADHLVHMQREELEGNRALWAYRTDEELLALRRRIADRVPPARKPAWLALMLAAGSLPERAELLAGLRALLPDPVFRDVTAPARAALGEACWSEVARAAGCE